MKSGEVQWFVFHLNPVPWAVGPVGTKNVGGKRVPIIGQNTELKTYQDAVKTELARQGAEMLNPDMPYKMRVWFWRNVAQYKSHQARTARSNEADLTNLQKGLEDALHGVLFKNDKNNLMIESVVVRQDPDTYPKIVLAIEEVALSQVFDSTSVIPDTLYIMNPYEGDKPEEADKWTTSEQDF